MSGGAETARVVIIGGGAVGVSALYHLAKAGWTDCTLLEKTELTAGSTWHAAGNVPTFSTSWAIMNMQRYSTELYARLGAEVDYPINYNVTGSIRLAHGPERMREFRRACGMGRHQGMELEILGVGEIRSRHPFLETHDIAGALYDPADGDMDPAQLTQALARGARALGARIERFRPATGVGRAGDEWVVHTEKGDIRCEFVVNAAGYYARARRRLVPALRRPPGADGGHEPPVSRVRGGSGRSGLVESGRAEAAAAARRGRVLLPAAGEGRFQSWPLRARLSRALGRARGPASGGFQLSAVSRTISTGWSRTSPTPSGACPFWPRPGWPKSSTVRSPTRPTATR